MNPDLVLPADDLATLVRDARQRTLALVSDLDDEQWQGPMLDIVNPPLWEVGHVANFYEAFMLRPLGYPPRIANGNELYNSFIIPHDDRWSLPLPPREGTLAYAREVMEGVLGALREGAPDARTTYLALLAVQHEDMHDEAFTYTRQTLGYGAPALPEAAPPVEGGGPLPGDVEVPGGTLALGAAPGEPFVFDNEKWAHPVQVAPFRIARAPVTNAEFAAFVEAGGYREERYWGFEGWRWRTRAGVEQPPYWRHTGNGWERRHYDRWVPLEPHHPVSHVSWFEALAYCAWAGRRLPTEAEWELAAAGAPGTDPADPQAKRRYPWGDEAPDAARANLDGVRGGCVDVGALPAGDSAWGCRQMLGNVWEWTASPFYPFPGYIVDQPYKEYSAPWFGDRMVLRGGAWATRGRLVRNTYRNFFTPDRRDVFAGFRTCAL